MKRKQRAAEWIDDCKGAEAMEGIEGHRDGRGP
jgi:hypothetical protein